MADLRVCGGRPLSGEITPSANKNAVLPILCATLLTAEPVRLIGVPDITDVAKILDMFRRLGSRVDMDHRTGVLEVEHRAIAFDPTRDRMPEEMRSSIMLVPPLLARCGVARIERDVTGCSLGAREIDPHMEVFERFGARAESVADALVLRRSGARFAGVDHWADYASVTATENFVLCAVLASGRSTLTNAASEPHVQEFCDFMQTLGARISGVGTSRLVVDGVERLHGGEFRFAEDFHEITTFLALGAITGGSVMVRNSRPDHFPLIDRTFAKLGVSVAHEGGWSSARVIGDRLRVREPFTSNISQKIEAAPWPYLPVDLLPIFVALGVRAEGSVLFWNKVYEGAASWSVELSKFGAHTVLCDPHRLITFGGKPLSPAEVQSPYIIRVAIALLMVAASIDGVSIIRGATPIRRAHPGFAENLARLGADVGWLS